jgi:hypothetical protein
LPSIKVQCPHCHTEASEIRAFLFQHSVAYCKECAWNIDKARTKLRTDMWAMWLLSGLGLLMAATAWVRGPYGIRGALQIAVPFVALPIGSGLVTWYRLSKVAVRQRDSTKQVVHGPTAAASPTLAVRERMHDVSYAMRPRVVRLTTRGYLYSAGMALVTAFVLWLLSFSLQGIAGPSNADRTKSAFILLVWGFSLWSCVSFYRNRIREKRLFTNGEVSEGVVLTQSDARIGSRIVYSYRDGGGSSFQNRAIDFSNKLYEEMSIHVFYDPLNPRESAALEGSLYLVG